MPSPEGSRAPRNPLPRAPQPVAWRRNFPEAAGWGTIGVEPCVWNPMSAESYVSNRMDPYMWNSMGGTLCGTIYVDPYECGSLCVGTPMC